MTKSQIVADLNLLRSKAETHSNALDRADMVEAIDKLASAIEAMPAPEPVDTEWLAEDYRIARQFVVNEYASRWQESKDAPSRTEYHSRRISETNAAGDALNRLAAALGIETPALAARVPQMQQAPLIERGKVEMMG